jgi:hypothetical protein
LVFCSLVVVVVVVVMVQVARMILDYAMASSHDESTIFKVKRCRNCN